MKSDNAKMSVRNTAALGVLSFVITILGYIGFNAPSISHARIIRAWIVVGIALLAFALLIKKDQF